MSRGSREGLYRRRGKRWLDLAITIPAVVVIAPTMGIIGVLVWRRMGRPVLFRQQRPGYRGRAFRMVKFRTMTEERNADGALLPPAQRVTRLGRFLRKTSLDELPELFNVLKGEMSLVGPRPLRMEYLPLYDREQARRHDVMPGITGLAQVTGRNNLTWDEKLAMDVRYVDELSLSKDLEILVRTLFTVVRREGIDQSAQQTMEPFKGAQLDG